MFSLHFKVNFLYVAITAAMSAVALPMVVAAAMFVVLPFCSPFADKLVKLIHRMIQYRADTVYWYAVNTRRGYSLEVK